MLLQTGTPTGQRTFCLGFGVYRPVRLRGRGRVIADVLLFFIFRA
jgi:hypothetical protein